METRLNLTQALLASAASLTLALVGCQETPAESPDEAPEFTVEGGCEAGHLPPPPSDPSTTADNPLVVEHYPFDEIVAAPCTIVEDLDKDGRLDVGVALENDKFEGSMAILWGTESGWDERRYPFPEDFSPYSGCSSADTNGDGQMDVLVGTIEGDVVIMESIGNREFDLLLNRVQFPESSYLFPPMSIVHVDLDGTEPLDLFVATDGLPPACHVDAVHNGFVPKDKISSVHLPGQSFCLVGHADGTYSEAPEGICPSDMNASDLAGQFSTVLADFNVDGRADLVVARTFAENLFLMSRPDKGFDDVTDISGIGKYNMGMGLALFDLDGDGIRDLYVSDFGPDQLWRGVGCGYFDDISNASGVAKATEGGIGFGIAPIDLEHDGDLDLLVVNSEVHYPDNWDTFCDNGILPTEPTQVNYLLINDGVGVFTKVDIPHTGTQPRRLHRPSLGRGDLDRDGDIDVASTQNDQLHFYWNKVEEQGHWISVRPHTAQGVPALGALVTIRSDTQYERWTELYGYYGVDGHSALEAHFGLGQSAEPVTVTVAWPDGSKTTLEDQAVDQHLVITQ